MCVFRVVWNPSLSNSDGAAPKNDSQKMCLSPVSGPELRSATHQKKRDLQIAIHNTPKKDRQIAIHNTPKKDICNLLSTTHQENRSANCDPQHTKNRDLQIAYLKKRSANCDLFFRYDMALPGKPRVSDEIYFFFLPSFLFLSFPPT